MRLFLSSALLCLWPAFIFAQTAPSLPVLPPAQPLPSVTLAWDRGACTQPQDCPPLPSHWYLYRNDRFVRKLPTAYALPADGDRAYHVERSTATKSIAVAAVNEFVDLANPPRVSARSVLAVQNPTIVQNPTLVKFQCPDHAQDTAHEIDIVNVATGAVVQTLSLGDPAPDAQGFIVFNVNVQPIAHGNYTIRARSVTGAVKSPNSPDSDVWERSPGPPSKPIVQ